MTLFLAAAIASCGGGSTIGPAKDAGGSGGVQGSGGSGGSTGSGGISGTGGALGSGGTVGTGGESGSGGSVGSGGTSGDAGQGCGDQCKVFFPDGQVRKTYACCGNACADTDNDPLNCGACGTRCPSDKPLCLKPPNSQPASCVAATCGDGIYPRPVCSGGTTCCGRDCCQANQICCNLPGAIDHVGCWTPTAAQPSCPRNDGLSMSDRNIKRAVLPVDPQQVLAKVSKLPISTWQYLADPDSVRHMGPMAQDFKQAFGLGDSDRWYHSVDGHGVALAAIQALAKLTAEQQQRLDLLQRQNRALEARLKAVERK